MTIRTAVIGYGTGRVFHAPLIDAEPRLELSTIVTGNAQRAAAAAERHPRAKVLADVDEVLSRRRVRPSRHHEPQ